MNELITSTNKIKIGIQMNDFSTAGKGNSKPQKIYKRTRSGKRQTIIAVMLLS